jgi:Rab-binding domain (RBD)
VHPLPLSDVQALRKHVPSFGTHHVVVVLGNGLTLPPLFFTQGGVRAMFAALKQVRLLAAASGSMPAGVCRCVASVLLCSLRLIGH